MGYLDVIVSNNAFIRKVASSICGLNVLARRSDSGSAVVVFERRRSW